MFYSENLKFGYIFKSRHFETAKLIPLRFELDLYSILSLVYTYEAHELTSFVGSWHRREPIAAITPAILLVAEHYHFLSSFNCNISGVDETIIKHEREYWTSFFYFVS